MADEAKQITGHRNFSEDIISNHSWFNEKTSDLNVADINAANQLKESLSERLKELSGPRM